MKLAQVLKRGTRGAQPAASSVAPGVLYFVTNEGLTEQSDGTTWLTYSGSGGGGGAPTAASYLVAVSSGTSLPNSVDISAQGPGFLWSNGSGGIFTDAINLATTDVFGILPVAKGGTGTATPGLVNGTLISVTGSWPNQTVNFTGTQLASPLTTKGDLWGYSTVNARIPVGTDGQVLTADSTVTLGVKWATPGGGGSGTVNSGTATQLAFYNSTGTAVDSTPAFRIISGVPTITATGTNSDVVLAPDGTGNVRFGGAASAYCIADSNGKLSLFAVGTDQNIALSPSGAGGVTIPTGVPSTSTTTGVLKVNGGIGVTGAIWAAAFNGSIGATTPASGAFTTITGTSLAITIAGNGGIIVNETSSGQPYLLFNIASSNYGLIGLNNGVDGLVTGPDKTLGIRAFNQAIVLSGDNGTTPGIRISATNKIYVLLPTSAAGLATGELWNNLGIVNVA